MQKTCLICGNQYTKKGNCSLKSWQKMKYCNKACSNLGKKGKPSWNKGLKTSLEVREKQSKARLGKSPSNKGVACSEEKKEKIRKALQGRPTGRTKEKCNFWKGGKTAWRKEMTNSLQYKEWRRKVFERGNYTCQECGARGFKGRGKTVELHPHHIKEVSNFPELITVLSNGITLCIDCHRKTSSHGRRKNNATA